MWAAHMETFDGGCVMVLGSIPQTETNKQTKKQVSPLTSKFNS